MKTGSKTLLIVAAAVLVLLTGCSRADTNPGGIADVSNPWTESDQQGVLDATGFSMSAPEGASDVRYSYLAETGLAQMRYVLDGAEWIYRIQSADELTDISGMEYVWSVKEDGTVAGRDAVYCAWSGTDDAVSNVQVVNWYDAVTGVTYSLSASGQDLNGMDLQVYAETLYEPLQEEAVGDPDAERAEELDAYFLGEHIRSYDGSALTVAEAEDGAFAVDISIVRLCNLENGVGAFEDHKISFTVEDPNGNPMSGVIYRDSDNSLSIQITDSTWSYLPNGEVLDGFGK